MSINVLIVSKGHAYDHDAFLAMFEGMDDVTTTLVEQPAAQVVLKPEFVGEYDAVLFYDMSGIPGVGLTHDRADDEGQPTDDYRRSIEALLERGTGLLFLNHATVSWPNWPLWRSMTGSSFMLSEGDLNGKRVPGSGYRGGHGPHPNPTVRLMPVDPGHPVVRDMVDGFSVTDEIYLKTADFEANVVPLMRSDYAFVSENFTPPPLAPEAEQAAWNHPPGSNLLVWANAAGSSPIVATDLGDGPAAYQNPKFAQLIRNALVWVASAEAREWAASR